MWSIARTREALNPVVPQVSKNSLKDRYASAQELSDELDHFPGNEPIRARLINTGARLARWGRRLGPEDKIMCYVFHSFVLERVEARSGGCQLPNI